MTLRLVSFGLAAATALIASAPAFAQSTAVIQKNFQGNTTVGNGNTSVNENRQNYSVQGWKRTGDTGIVQDNGQVNETLGNRGVSINTNSQEFIEKYGKYSK
jgi:hypothetical protein